MLTPTLTIVCQGCYYKCEASPASPAEKRDFELAFRAAHIDGDHGQINWKQLKKDHQITAVVTEYKTPHQPRRFARITVATYQ